MKLYCTSCVPGSSDACISALSGGGIGGVKVPADCTEFAVEFVSSEDRCVPDDTLLDWVCALAVASACWW